MGLAMLSMDGMAQTTRQEYKDILDIQLTPGAPRRHNGCFTDMGSWMGFTLSEKEKPTAGFCGFQYLLPQLVCPFAGISH